MVEIECANDVAVVVLLDAHVRAGERRHRRHRRHPRRVAFVATPRLPLLLLLPEGKKIGDVEDVAGLLFGGGAGGDVSRFVLRRGDIVDPRAIGYIQTLLMSERILRGRRDGRPSIHRRKSARPN